MRILRFSDLLKLGRTGISVHPFVFFFGTVAFEKSLVRRCVPAPGKSPPSTHALHDSGNRLPSSLSISEAGPLESIVQKGSHHLAMVVRSSQRSLVELIFSL